MLKKITLINSTNHKKAKRYDEESCMYNFRNYN